MEDPPGALLTPCITRGIPPSIHPEPTRDATLLCYKGFVASAYAKVALHTTEACYGALTHSTQPPPEALLPQHTSSHRESCGVPLCAF